MNSKETDDFTTPANDVVYEMHSGITTAMAAIIGELAKEGISKDKKASGYGANFNFRGIDDVLKALAPLLAKHEVTITPRALSCQFSARETSKGGTLYHALLHVEFTLRHKDGSQYSGSAYGEACDSGDKAVGKAASYAFKSFALQAFCVPTEGMDDPDATVHPPSNPKRKAQMTPDLAAKLIRSAQDQASLDDIGNEIREADLLPDEKKALGVLWREQQAKLKKQED